MLNVEGRSCKLLYFVLFVYVFRFYFKNIIKICLTFLDVHSSSLHYEFRHLHFYHFSLKLNITF